MPGRRTRCRSRPCAGVRRPRGRHERGGAPTPGSSSPRSPPVRTRSTRPVPRTRPRRCRSPPTVRHGADRGGTRAVRRRSARRDSPEGSAPSTLRLGGRSGHAPAEPPPGLDEALRQPADPQMAAMAPLHRWTSADVTARIIASCQGTRLPIETRVTAGAPAAAGVRRRQGSVWRPAAQDVFVPEKPEADGLSSHDAGMASGGSPTGAGCCTHPACPSGSGLSGTASTSRRSRTTPSTGCRRARPSRAERSHPGHVRHGDQGQPVRHRRQTAKDPREPVDLMAAADGLGPKLGPILLQLPPTLRADPELLGACLGCFPAHVRVAVSRHVSWWSHPSARRCRRTARPCLADRRPPVHRLCRRPPTGATCVSTQGRADPGPRTATARSAPGYAAWTPPGTTAANST